MREATRLTLAAAGALAVLAAQGARGAERDQEKGPPEVTIDGEGRLRVGGEPFFPIGIYSVWPPEKLEEARALGFNTVHTYGGEGGKGKDNARSAEEMRAYLDAADRLGLKVFMGLPRFQVVKGDAKRLEERIKLLRDHPALLVWYLFDEPYHQKMPASAVKASADLLQRHDPDHPTVLVLCLLHERRNRHAKNPAYVSMPDILMTDRYPRTPGNADLSPVARDIAVARRLVKDEKPIWNVVQLHGKGPGGTGYGLREPDWAELRNMTYQSLAAGARGITFFAYLGSQFRLYKSPQGLKNARRIAAELRTLSPVLLSDRPKRPPFVVKKNDAILHRAFVHGGKAYLIVVNLRREKTTVTVSAASGRLPAEVKVLFENRAVRTADGKLIEEIEPIGVRVYEVGLGKGAEAMRKAPRIIAHRGASHAAADNTLPAFKLAWAEGADAIELDVQLTRDGRIVVFHDASIRVGGKKKVSVRSLTLGGLKAVVVRQTKRRKRVEGTVPGIEEVLATVPRGGQTFVEIKGRDKAIVPVLERVLRVSGKEAGQIVLIASNYDLLREAKRRMPGYKAFLLVEVKRDKDSSAPKQDLDDLVRRAKLANLDGLNLGGAFPQDWVERIHGAGLEVYVWTVNGEEAARRLKALGVDGITTDCPARIGKAVREAPAP